MFFVLIFPSVPNLNASLSTHRGTNLLLVHETVVP